MKKIIDIPVFAIMTVFIIAAFFLTLCNKKSEDANFPVAEKIIMGQQIIFDKDSVYIITSEKAPPDFTMSDDNSLARRSSIPGNYTLAAANIDSIQGVETNVDVLNLGNESGRSCWVAFRFFSGIWAQIGYKNNAIHVMEIYYGFITNIKILNGGTAPIFKGQKNKFFMKWISDSTWEAGRNGVSMFSFSPGCAYARNVQVGIEYMGSNARFPKLNFNPAMLVVKNGNWITPPIAWIQYKGKWGIEGHLQNPSLEINNINMAGNTPTTGSGFLWY